MQFRIFLASVLAMMALSFSVFAQTGAATDSAVVNTISWYPFRVDEKALTAQIDVTNAKIDQIYGGLYRKYGYLGNTRTWDSMVQEAISEFDVELSIDNNLDFSEDNTGLLIKAGSIEELERMLKAIQPTFASISKLETFVKTIRPSHIQDGHEEKPQ